MEVAGIVAQPVTLSRVERDSGTVPEDPEQKRRAIRAKTWHNTASLVAVLLSRWLWVFGAVLIGMLLDRFPTLPAVADTGSELLEVALTLGYFAVLERAALGFRRLRPDSCSIYERAFWRHERFWKLLSPMVPLINGTPLKPLLLRALGVRVGRKVFDDGCSIPEKTLVTIGDGATLNAGSIIQAHSLEDGGFKSDHIVVERGATLGVGAFIHYGVTIGEHATVDADSFLMKGEEIAPHQHWRGNPAQMIAGCEQPEAPRTVITLPERAMNGDVARAG